MKYLNIIIILLFTANLKAQSYPPPAGQEGSTAIPADSDIFLSWATGINLERGFVDISNPDFEDQGSNRASFGEAEDALGTPTNTPVSFGDAGVAILTFDTPIANGSGFDFAVFENAFSDTFLELALVEVSSDGENYFRFPAHSETQTETQVGGFGAVDARFINNLAGKYRALFGTPFDLSDLDEDPLLDKNNITHVKLIDVVGSIDPEFASFDAFGNAINDPFPTPFFSGGFDLDAIGVINQQTLSLREEELNSMTIYPNPTADFIQIKTTQQIQRIDVYSRAGRLVKQFENSVDKDRFDVSDLPVGMYLIKVSTDRKSSLLKLIKT
ncbi:T9SS type A sorting domain-containing protein [Psychroflexus tropicus]|uniref:T9SS type A sorting domain-containing protein n=1 Tax=Psychroflexus tropicus TaxID=197345 RepID=UPI00037AC0C8|nr:T9SS type A sorting domain-containing protein [Psychroflexus tropicus]